MEPSRYILVIRRDKKVIGYKGPRGPFCCDRSQVSGWRYPEHALDAADILRLTLAPFDTVHTELR